MQRLQISGAVRPLYGSLGVEGLISEVQAIGPTALRVVYSYIYYC
jgi:hypothetical protein